MRLPPLKALRAFEATARFGNMTDAAKHLFVTHSAISHQIKILERDLEAKLFIRKKNGLELTSLGVEYRNAILPAFAAIVDATARVKKGESNDIVRVSCLSLFLHSWLYPRLREFEKSHPEIDVHLVYSKPGAQDIPENVDVAIRVDSREKEWPGYSCKYLFVADGIPVCSPLYVEQHGPFNTLEDILDCNLLHDDNSTLFWEIWFRENGLDPALAKCGKIFVDDNLSVSSAIAGQGVANSPVMLVYEHLQTGVLVPFLGARTPKWGRDYFYLALWRPELLRSRNAILFLDWLVDTSHEFEKTVTI